MTQRIDERPDDDAADDRELEAIRTAVPGPESLALAARLREVEAREVTFTSPEFPVFWASAAGATVVDADGNRYLDAGAAFGVAALGHNAPAVVAAVAAQSARLLHGMGDVHPTGVRARLLARLAELTPGALHQSYLGLNGADAIEFARKTAYLATGRPAALRFSGAYHGLSYGALDLCGIARFRAPWEAQLGDRVAELPYPTAGATTLEAALATLEATLRARPEIGAIFIEPLAGRAGTLAPVAGYLRGLREAADRHGAVLVFDEIYTGFGRTGRWFACQEEDVVPDILCVGKALGGGLPLSAAIGTPAVMDAWPASTGEALHTATFLGSPPACAAALAVLGELERRDLPRRAAELGAELGRALDAVAARLAARTGRRASARGRGLMRALDLDDADLAGRAVVHALRRGLIVLQQGVDGRCLALTPALTIGRGQLARVVELLEAAVVDAAG